MFVRHRTPGFPPLALGRSVAADRRRRRLPDLLGSFASRLGNLLGSAGWGYDSANGTGGVSENAAPVPGVFALSAFFVLSSRPLRFRTLPDQTQIKPLEPRSVLRPP